MVIGDQQRWDAKHRAAASAGPGAPEGFLAESLPTIRASLVAAGRLSPAALDLACGSGRNALLLAREGFRVVAADVSPVALELVRERAAAEQVSIVTREVDLEIDPEIGRRIGRESHARGGGPPGLIELAREWHGFDLVTVVNYLARDLFAVVPAVLAPGGFLVWSRCTVARREGPSLRFCLERRELDGAFPSLETICSVERDGRAAILARRAPA